MFRAHDTAEGRLVAIKAFRLDIPPEQAAELAAALEALVADQPRHPAIAAALAAGADGSTAYLVQEYVAGEALDAVLRQFGPPPPAEAVATLTRIAEALDRAAGDGIHHGALHPRDILIGEGGDAHVIDLGVAQALDRCGVRVPVRRPYSAPERVEGHAWGGPADIFSLGAIAFELITGRRLPGPGRPDVSAPALSHVAADDVAAALARALSEDPAERYPSASDLVDALAPALKTARRAAADTPRRASAAASSMPLPLDEPQKSEAPESSSTVAPAAPEQPETSHDLLLVLGPQGEPERFVDVGEPTRRRERHEPAPPAIESDPGATLAFAPGPASTAGTRASDIQPSVLWPTPSASPPLERRPFLPFVVALIVGVAAGFGWGYWTAWQSPARQAAVESAPDTPDVAATPAPPAETTVNVDEPEVIGERNLPPPGAASRSATGRGAAAANQPPPGASGQSAANRPAAPASSRAAAPAGRPTASAPRAAAAAPRPAAPGGRLTVRSTPPGARVLVDGQLRGQTPLDLRDLPLRAMRVTIEEAGFAPEERRVALTAANPSATVNARLTRQDSATVASRQASAAPQPSADAAPAVASAGTGALVVDSRPAGARVFVDEREIGVTPLSLPGLAAGRHRVRLELDGFNTWVTTADVTVGSRTRVAASLEQRGVPE